MVVPFASAILVAAGRSSRMGNVTAPKPLLPLLDRPVLEYSLKALCQAPAIAEVVVVARPEQFPAIGGLLDPFRKWVVDLVPGGEERFHSVCAGCDKARSTSEVLLIHDAARPLIEAYAIEKVALAAREDGAAVLATAVTDSLHRSMDGRKAFEPVDRSNLWAAQTPQAFQAKAFRGALEEAQRIGTLPTDDVALYERFVGAVTLVPGNPENIKITHPSDLTVAESLLRKRRGH